MVSVKEMLILVVTIILGIWDAIHYFVVRPRLCMALLVGAHTCHYVAMEYSLIRYVFSTGIYAC